MMRHFRQDLRYALRGLARNPGFSATAILTLAVGLGANATVFSIVYAALLRPLPYPEPDRLMQIWETKGKSSATIPVSPYNLDDWREQAHSFESIAAYQNDSFLINGADGAPERLLGLLVSSNFFTVFKTQPMLGRAFLPEDDVPGGRRVAVLSNRCWRERFEGNPAAVGKTVRLNGETYTIMGVAPPEFQFPREATAVWAPPAFDKSQVSRGSHFLNSIGRLRAGVDPRRAQAEMDAIATRAAQLYPDSNRGSGVQLIDLQRQLSGNYRTGLFALWLTVALLMLIACVNIANLLLVRAAARQREVALRAALGASGSRLFGQMLTESLVLSGLGGLVGIALAAAGTRAIAVARPDLWRVMGSSAPNLAVLIFTAAVSLLAGLLFGCAPALKALSLNLADALRGSGSRHAGNESSSRLHAFLMASEIALALLLLISSSLVVESFIRLRAVDPGFRPAGVLTMQISLPEAKYATRWQRVAFFHDVTAGVAALPGVESVGGVNDLPFSGSRTQVYFGVDGLPQTRASAPTADYRIVSPGYFRALGLAVRPGRPLLETDGRETPPVAVINDVLAATYFAGKDPIGRHLSARGRKFEIVGVASGLKHDNLAAGESPEIYASYLQSDPPPWIFLAVRTRNWQPQLISEIRQVVRRLDGDLAVYDVHSMQERIYTSIAAQRFDSFLLGAFGLLALTLAAMGVYGGVAYAVSRRTNEIGIRMALGASRLSVLGMVLVRVIWNAAAGIAIGLGGAWLATRLLNSLLYGVKARDPLIFIAAPLVLALVALAAALGPALRAAKVDPGVALMYE